MVDQAQRPAQLGQALTEPIYQAILEALDKEQSRKLDVFMALLHPSDIADLLERLPQNNRQDVFTHIPKSSLGDVLVELSDSMQQSLLESCPTEDVAELVNAMESDDVADLVQHMEQEQAEQTIELMSDIQQSLLEYPEDTAGGIMQLEVLSAPKSWTVGRLLDYIRKRADILPDNISNIFVVNYKRELKGSISISRLVRYPEDELLKSVMREDTHRVLPETSEKDVAKMFEKYDLNSCPVVDEQNRLLGRITVDDILDVVIEQSEKEILQTAGISEDEDLLSTASETARSRLPWLIVNLFTAVLASIVVALFADQIERLVALAVLMPIVASMGGNAGTQTLTVTIRGLATNTITAQNAFYLMRKEFLAGGFNGIILGVFLALGTILVYDDTMLGLVILSATILNHLFAALSGNLIPLVINKLGKDPALSSGVLVTTVTDVMGFFTFLGLASLLLL